MFITDLPIGKAELAPVDLLARKHGYRRAVVAGQPKRAYLKRLSAPPCRKILQVVQAADGLF